MTLRPLLATVAALLASSAAGLAQAEAVNYVVEPTHTFVSFEISHFGTSLNRGRWDKKEGKITLDRAARSGRAEITIDMASINTGVAQFDGHLKSKDFFDVAQHPSAKFVGERFVFSGDKLAEVQGQLTLVGKTQPVTLKAQRFNCYDNPMLKREVCGGDFETTIKRSQWGITYGMPAVAPDEVRLLIQIEAIKQ